ncbi:hypothetical protein V1292_004864 [Bradyrhizobium sp. AZCC 1719]|uniref:hypothetical protein n=1 Tax=Bradyrhizobium sp. AZCC 1719 TaxID=3117028 RepID=UPI002FF15125
MTRLSARAAPLKKATMERGRLAAAQANLAEIKPHLTAHDFAEIDAEIRAALGGSGNYGDWHRNCHRNCVIAKIHLPCSRIG